MTAGRPKIAAMDRKSKNLTFRTRGSMRDELRRAASAADRSMSEEIEWRLNLTFIGHSITQIRGRPRLNSPQHSDRVPLGLRVSARIKNAIDTAANINGRSQSQEAELRLEQSFRDDFIIKRIEELVR